MTSKVFNGGDVDRGETVNSGNESIAYATGKCRDSYDDGNDGAGNVSDNGNDDKVPGNGGKDSGDQDCIKSKTKGHYIYTHCRHPNLSLHHTNP
ncbi:hypothetical protein K7432_012250 [Basidiobolus ranarum]|uniref:Uncharacterized protein n=1 Tax=Basidiobolus ranarum TaxID=34480 RepID=A0ABR2VSZ5_9FUNG